MPVSMSLSARYVTQSSVYSSPFTGPLTDRRIAYYQKRGYFSKSSIVDRTIQRKVAATRRRLTKEQVFAKFDL